MKYFLFTNTTIHEADANGNMVLVSQRVVCCDDLTNSKLDNNNAILLYRDVLLKNLEEKMVKMFAAGVVSINDVVDDGMVVGKSFEGITSAGKREKVTVAITLLTRKEDHYFLQVLDTHNDKETVVYGDVILGSEDDLAKCGLNLFKSKMELDDFELHRSALYYSLRVAIEQLNGVLNSDRPDVRFMVKITKL